MWWIISIENFNVFDDKLLIPKNFHNSLEIISAKIRENICVLNFFSILPLNMYSFMKACGYENFFKKLINLTSVQKSYAENLGKWF